jgi:glycosyltransferase involved in cell wall biosynthesis
MSKYDVQESKMTYIPNSINIQEYKKSNLKNKRILFTGRLIENKGVKFFSQIIKEIPLEWTFTIIGDGPMRRDVEILANQYKNIEYLGRIPKSEINQLLSKTDILILPTFAEGSPRVVLEAAASGVPSVVFDVGDVPVILDNNKNGFIIKRYDINEFIDKMRQLIIHPKLRKDKGIAARKYAEKNLDWKVNYKKMITEIDHVIHEEINKTEKHRLDI